MTDKKRLQKALAKIEKRKKRLHEKGITEPSKFGYTMRRLIAPLFRFGVSLLYPKSGNVHLGNVKRKDIKRLTKGQPVIYAIMHRGIFDVARYITYVLPHSYLILGDERSFYCTINEPLIRLNGVLFVDRDDPKDSRMIIERATRLLRSKQSIIIAPEGTPNVYTRDMLRLFPGVIKIALETGAVIVPVGNQVDIVRHRRSRKIISDINYTMYEDYNVQFLFNPSDNTALVTLHKHLKDFSYINITDNKKMNRYIHNGKFVLENIVFDLEEKLQEYLMLRPKLKSHVNKHTKEYLTHCAVLNEYRKMLIDSLSILEQRMKILSDNISDEIDRRNPKNKTEHEKDRQDYIDFCLDVQERVAKKGRSNEYDEFRKFINSKTDESIIENEMKNVMKGIEIIIQNKNCI
jgi:1-acyl-sn-glycerol-3-phosphate acyltransferase